MTLQDLINGWKLNKELLSFRMKMPVGTFKHKFNETNGKYRFTEAEKEQLYIILRELSTDIELVAGITFKLNIMTKEEFQTQEKSHLELIEKWEEATDFIGSQYVRLIDKNGS